ncbi:MAG: Ig-like domain-containing protein [Terracidiphilus sp.]
MRSLIGRFLRLELVTTIGIALALPALALPTAETGSNSRALATETTVTAEYHDQGGRTYATLSVAVTGQEAQPATGAVVIQDAGKPLAGVALNAQGEATVVVSLLPGEHRLTAVYSGDFAHQGSVSQLSTVRAVSSSTPDFGIAVAPATLSLAAGQSGAVIASITPINAASLTAPMFVTLSCAGLPDQSSCTFTPENLEILPNATAAVTSSMVLTTAAGSSAHSTTPVTRSSSPVAWAVLLPGVLGLAGLAFGTRRRRWLSRFSLLALVGLVSVLGTTACNPLYYYKNHGPPQNLPTPTGTYTVSINAQSSNGIVATTHSTTFVLTVK